MAREFSLYKYTPNQTVCLVALSLFGLSAIYHLYQMIKKKTWFYTSLVVGSFMMTLGYLARYFSIQDTKDIMPYALQSILIILPPSLYAATIYMTYGRIALFVAAPEASIIRPTRVTKIFVIGDVFAFLMQGGGGGMMAQASMAETGKMLTLGGLFVQLLFFGFFLFVSVVFWKRMRHSSKRYTTPQVGKYPWNALLMLLFAASAIIILRCVFRIIEFAQGHDGYLMSREVYLYVFDAAPMFVVQVMFHFVHAGDVFPPRNGYMQKMGNQSEAEIALQERV